MSQLNTDLEANLVPRRRSLTNSTNDQSLLQDSQSDASSDNDRGDTLSQIQNSVAFNFLAAFVPGPKILTSIIILCTGGAPCIGSKQIWIMCMIVHDVLHFIVVALRIHSIVGLERLNSGSLNGSQANLNQQPDQGSQTEALVGSDNSSQMAKIIKRRALAKQLYNVCTYCWLALFLFWLELNIILDENECDTQQIDTLVLAYIILGWVWLLNPLLICFAGCLCFPVILIILCLFGKPTQTAATQIQIKNLEVKQYTSDLPGNKECAICMVDYEDADKIIQLKCSDMHHFHEGCLKDWLKINGQCPICRARLGETKNSTSNNNQVIENREENLRL